MLKIVLLILKIAGIILAAVLGILIVGICCVLFVPVRYRGNITAADAEDGKKKEISAVLKAAWLLRLVRVYVSYEESVRVRIKLLFFTLMDTAKERDSQKEKKKPKKEKKKPEKEKKKKREIEEERREGENAGGTVKAAGSSKTENASETSAGNMEDGPSKDESDQKIEDGSSKDESDQKSEDSVSKDEPGRKSREIKKGIKKRISNILQTIRDFCDKLKRIKEKAEQLKELWTSGHMVRSRSLLWKQFLYLLKHTKPRKLDGYIRFGFEDPSATGYAMAIYGISCSIWRSGLSVEPDFEKPVLDCHVIIKGKIRVWHFLKAALVLFFSKDIRHAIKDIKEL